MNLLLGIDLGTSYFKVGLFDATGALRGLGRVAVAADTPAPGRVELPVVVFWSLLRHALAEALMQARARPSDIAALSYASQANTMILLDRDDHPLTPLILWTDTRGGPPDGALQSFAQRADFFPTTGLGAYSAESAVCKWRWWQNHEPSQCARTHRLLTLADYFTFSLTGETVGDTGTAALLGLYALSRQQWWTEALQVVGLRPEQLAMPLLPGTPCGRTLPPSEALLGVPAERPFAVGGLDHHIAALGAGLGHFAEVSLSTGTVLAALCSASRVEARPGCYHGLRSADATNTASASLSSTSSTFAPSSAASPSSLYYRLAFDPAGAGQLEDYQKRHASELSLEQLLLLAARDAPLDAPSHASAVYELLVRITRTQSHLLRRIAPEGPVTAITATGGGARSAFWLQLAADVLGVRLVTSACEERACLGAAALASVAAGWHAHSGEALRAMVRLDRVFEPTPGRASAVAPPAR